MRWTAQKSSAENTHKRTRKSFLFLPKTIQYQTRWLEWAVWREEFYADYSENFWQPLYWIN